MKKCYICRLDFQNPEELFEHIKHIHGLCGKNAVFKCMQCDSEFKDFSSFKKHVRNCNRVPLGYVEDNNELFEKQQMIEFQTVLKREALIMALEIMGNMNFARCVGFEMIRLFRKFLLKLVDGLKLLIGPIATIDNEHILEEFITIIQSSFDDVSNERSLDKTLFKNDLICSLKKYVMLTENCENTEDGEDVNSEGEAEDDNNGEELEPDEEEMIFKEKAKFCLSPIHFQIKKFSELPNVFETVMQNTAAIQRQPRYSHFNNGDLWKEKLKAYKKDDIVIPYHLYMDGVQMNNALGAHTSAGSLNCSYYIFPTIPSQYQSRLENIFTAGFHSVADIKKHGKEASFNTLIDELSELATKGLTLKIKGEDVKSYFVLGVLLGDNLSQNDLSGFTTSFSNGYCCRYCRIHITDLKTQFTEDEQLIRNRSNYEEDLLLNNLSQTGLKEVSILNEIPLFHVTESVSTDITHNLQEGIYHYNLAESILHWVKEKKHFRLAQLNERVQAFDYGENEKGNKPSIITMKKLKKKKFSMSASEMNCFIRNLGFIIGDLVPNKNSDIGWELHKNTVNYGSTCFSPTYDDEDIEDLNILCESVNKVYVEKHKQTMKFKHHSGLHYKRLTQRFGPLTDLKVIRLEAKHREMKNYGKNTNSRKHLSFSLARKVQYNTALRILKAEGFQDEISTLKTKTIRLNEQLQPTSSSSTSKPPKWNLRNMKHQTRYNHA